MPDGYRPDLPGADQQLHNYWIPAYRGVGLAVLAGVVAVVVVPGGCRRRKPRAMSAAGYLDSPWPAEDGGPQRLQVPRAAAGSGLQAGEPAALHDSRNTCCRR
jgi:hypothetical protein